jgi:Zn-dependent peptidase ImmA (M78 family)
MRSFTDTKFIYFNTSEFRIIHAMEKIQSINASRILWACADNGITPEQVASELGISQTSIEQVLAGAGGLTYNQLSKIGNFFGRGALFFLEPGAVDEKIVYSPAFRTLANEKPELSPKIKALIRRVEKQRDIYLSLREDLDDSDFPTFDPPRLFRENIIESARATRTWLGLGTQNNFLTYRAAIEARGILVFRSNGYNGKWQIAKESPILAFTLYDKQCPVIVVKKLAAESRQSFSLVHELGHLLLHKESSIDDENDMRSSAGKERDANAFAGYLLVPDAFLRTIVDADRPNNESEYEDWLEIPRKTLGVSTEVILRRLLDSGRLSQASYTAYREWRAGISTPLAEGGTRIYRYREPKHVFGETFVKTVLDSLSANNITLARASSYLDGIKIKDLHQLESLYAGV